MKRNKLFKCTGIGMITIIIVITVILIVKREDYYIRKVSPSTEESIMINATGIDDLLSFEFRIKSPNGFPLEKELILQRYIGGKLKEEEFFNAVAVYYTNMKLKVDEGKVFFTKIGFEEELGFELYHLFSTTKWSNETGSLKNVQLPLKSKSLSKMTWEFDEYKDIKFGNEYILRIAMYDENGMRSLEQEILDKVSKGNKESLEIILKKYPIVEILKIKVASMDDE